MRILVVTPSPPHSGKGNRVTALRWARLFRRLGHRVTVRTVYRDEPCDLLVALHARKSHASVERFCRERPEAPVVVALTGTDLYQDLATSSAAMDTLEAASRIVVLQPLALEGIPGHLHAKTRVIHQSASAVCPRGAPAGGAASPPGSAGGPRRPAEGIGGSFDVCVSGHLREVKDPFLPALAARLLPASSRIRIVHVGVALSGEMERRARAEESANPRYHWLGGVPRRRALEILAASRLLVLPSLLEGGANAISEAIAAAVPILASRIPGSAGILGEDYPGLFPAGDAGSLAELLARCESDAGFYGLLAGRCDALKPLVDPALEQERWARLLAELVPETPPPRLSLVEGLSAVDPGAFAHDVADGLARRPKRLHFRYFYDEPGSRLFEEICDLPEYYLSRAERGILAHAAREIVSLVPRHPSVVEFGSGNSAKTRLLLAELVARDGAARYVPVDISRSVLLSAARALMAEYPTLEVAAVAGDYEDGLRQLDREARRRKLVLWLGSNIGNFERAEASAFLASVGSRLSPEDCILVGIDLRKDAAVLVAAYADSRGVTERFNKNILARINRELGGRFDPDSFEHSARWDETLGRIEMHLVSTRPQTVTIGRPPLEVSLAAGESIHTENSYKYSPAEIDALARDAGLRTVRRWLDPERRFSLNLFAPTAPPLFPRA